MGRARRRSGCFVPAPALSTVSVALPYRLEAGTVFSEIDDRYADTAAGDGQPRSGGKCRGPGDPGRLPYPRRSRQPGRPPRQPKRRRRRPRRWASPQSKPASTKQPTETAVAGEQVTAAASPTPGETLTAVPDIAPATIVAAATAAPAGEAAPPQPRSLPNTAEPGDPAIWPVLISVVLLLISGWFLHRWALR